MSDMGKLVEILQADDDDIEVIGAKGAKGVVVGPPFAIAVDGKVIYHTPDFPVRLYYERMGKSKPKRRSAAEED